MIPPSTAPTSPEARKEPACAGGQTICAGKLMLSDGVLYVSVKVGGTVLILR